MARRAIHGERCLINRNSEVEPAVAINVLKVALKGAGRALPTFGRCEAGYNFDRVRQYFYAASLARTRILQHCHCLVQAGGSKHIHVAIAVHIDWHGRVRHDFARENLLSPA